MATKGGGVLLLVLGVVSTGLVGCGKSHRTLNAKTDGVIVQQDSKSQEELQALFPAHKVSVINKEDHVYKIQNATLKEVNETLPSVYAEEDMIFNMKGETTDVENPDFFKKRSIQDELDKLNCTAIKKGGNLDVQGQPNVVAPNTVEVGTEDIVFFTTRSAAPTTGSPVADFLKNPLENTPWGTSSDSTIQWLIEAPAGSNTLKKSNQLSFPVTPDRAGAYLVVVVEKNNSTGTCLADAMMIGATQNKKFSASVGAKGQYSSEKFFHVTLANAEQAWDVTQGEGVTIAIVDSGVNYNHPDLHDNIKKNTNEVPDNGIDDDKNGYVDDVYGWDFAIGDEYPYDDESHGTHVAGLAASSVSGIAKRAKILPVKAMLPTGSGTISSLISGIYYAVKQKADVINLSLGGPGKASPLLLAAIKKAQEAGILVVAASGNSTANTDVVPSHVTSADGSNVLAIAATDENDNLAEYSNYGKSTVDLAAPGGTEQAPLASTYAHTDLSKYIGFYGTSMACPVTAGAAALVKAANPSLSAEQIKAVLVRSAKKVSALNGKVTSGALLDVYSAVTSANVSSMELAGL